MLKLWFMFDDHTFSRIALCDREYIINRVSALFRAGDGGGTLFVRDSSDCEIPSLTKGGRKMEDGWGLPQQEIESWVDDVLAEAAFRRAIMA